ncbi:MAG: hypothetical protein PHW53_00015 [Patescibacteria group bacterium]|nr:hypothetical protein [Patescibacteria group bacterium]
MWKDIETSSGIHQLDVEEIGGSRMLVIMPRVRIGGVSIGGNSERFPDGAVLISRREKNREFYQVYRDGVYSALRSRAIIQRQYGEVHTAGERHNVAMGIGSARVFLEHLIRYGQLSDEEREDVYFCLEELAKTLKCKRNESKVEARDYLELSADSEDSLGRENPMANCAELAAGMSHLTFRLTEIPEIAKYIGLDEVRLMAERDRHLTSCHQLYWKLIGALEKRPFKHAGKYSKVIYPLVERWLQQRIQDISEWRVAPFTRTRNHAIAELKDALSKSQSGSNGQAAILIRRVANSLNFKRAQYFLEQILMGVSLIEKSLKSDASTRNADFSISRASDLAADLGDLRVKLTRFLHDGGFQFKPKNLLIHHVDMAGRALAALEWQPAKKELKAATALL